MLYLAKRDPVDVNILLEVVLDIVLVLVQQLLVIFFLTFDQQQLPKELSINNFVVFLILVFFIILFSFLFFIKLTPTPNPFIETIVNAARSVVITPTTNAAGNIAKLIRFKK